MCWLVRALGPLDEVSDGGSVVWMPHGMASASRMKVILLQSAEFTDMLRLLEQEVTKRNCTKTMPSQHKLLKLTSPRLDACRVRVPIGR